VDFYYQQKTKCLKFIACMLSAVVHSANIFLKKISKILSHEIFWLLIISETSSRTQRIV